MKMYLEYRPENWLVRKRYAASVIFAASKMVL